MNKLFQLTKPFLHALDPEDAHKVTIKSLKYAPICASINCDPMLQQNICGLDFKHPLGLAAGFDKGADVMLPMLNVGMSHVEAGTVTPLSQDGNPRPRIFRDKNTHSVINRMGFPNPGADIFFKNFLQSRDKNKDAILGANIGKNKDSESAVEDYTILAARCEGIASYITINISSPNTPGLRDLQNGDFVRECVAAVRKEFKGPIWLKLAPDLNGEQLKDLAQACMGCKIDAVILTNTTLERPTILPSQFAQEKGGLSGKLLTKLSQKIIGQFYTLTKGKIPIVGVGGIMSVQDAYDHIKAGASLLQVYSGLVFYGPQLVKDVIEGLPVLLKKDGYNSISEAIGANHK